ncbi:coiled-coil domain-containing protein 81-like [Pholidichthys leucotaenia]
MTDILQLVSEQDKWTLPTLSKLSKKDIQSIWADVSTYIEHQMTLQKGVHLAGLGTFTLAQQKLDLGNKLTLMQRPIFLISGKLIQSLGLKQTRPLAAAKHLPVVQLNYAALSRGSPHSRDTVEGCVRETLLLLFRSLASEKKIFLTFEGIGRLSFSNNKVQMKFNREFISAMDGTGKLLMGFSKGRGSSISSLSGGKSKLQKPESASPLTLPTAYSPQPDNKAGDKDRQCFSQAPDQRNAAEAPQQRESKSYQMPQPARMEAVSSKSEDPNPKPHVEATENNKAGSSLRLDTANSPPLIVEDGVNMSCSGHIQAGQELCYLCMQRAQRNVPVFLREKQQKEEKEQEKLLLLSEQLRDRKYMEEEQKKLKAQREHAKQVAAFNLQMSEKKVKTQCPMNTNSFIFPARALTPPRFTRQHHYMNDLQNQIESRQTHETQDQQNRLLMECLDRVQLTQEIALQKAQQLQQKQERTKHYKKALNTQVEEMKASEAPECQPDNIKFKRRDTPVCNAESRERAQKLFQANFSAAAQRKNEDLQNHQEQLEKEREMLKHTKKELIFDHMKRFEKRRDIIKSLEADWSRSAKLKQNQEEEERRFMRSAGQLLVDKLAEYRRCCQCKRRTSNSGETNIWKDSHYLSGSQFMS